MFWDATGSIFLTWKNCCLHLQVSPLNEIDKILDCEMRPTKSSEQGSSDAEPKPIFVKQYLVKWKGLSYLHCSW